MTTETHQQTAERLGLIFNGMQAFPGGIKRPVFTEGVYHTSFVVMDGETTEEAVERKRKQFEGAKK